VNMASKPKRGTRTGQKGAGVPPRIWEHGQEEGTTMKEEPIPIHAYASYRLGNQRGFTLRDGVLREYHG